mmetsp:Transcript_36803/g.97710  ORF Transcript_36803/g.97710 Transcript_36803/m.97710 type:complete len:100 (-) Transcript_36803:405-704(-)
MYGQAETALSGRCPHRVRSGLHEPDTLLWWWRALGQHGPGSSAGSRDGLKTLAMIPGRSSSSESAIVHRSLAGGSLFCHLRLLLVREFLFLVPPRIPSL